MAIVQEDNKTIKESWVADYYELIWNEADSYFTEEVIHEWWENMSLYHNVHARDKKFTWQSDVKEPIVQNLIDKLSNFLTRSLVSESSSDNPFFTFTIPNNKARAQAYRELVNSVLDSNKWTREIFNLSLKRALATSVYYDKVVPVREMISTPQQVKKDNESITLKNVRTARARTFIKSINPFDMRLDPHGDRYIIEIERLSIPEIMALAKEQQWFNVETAVKAGFQSDEDSGERTESDEMNRSRVVIHGNNMGTLHHVYAKVLPVNEGGKSLPEIKDHNIYFIMLNGNLVHYTHNLLPKGRFPYVKAQPVRHIVGRYGKGFISMLKSLICEYLNMLSLTVDEATRNILPVYERDMSTADNESADVNASEIVPGRVYSSRDGQSLRQISNPNTTQIGSSMTFTFERLIQNRSSVSEFFEGRPTAKGRPTLGEIEIKTNRNDSFIADMANEIESSVIEELLELVLMTELVYMDDPDRPDLKQIVNTEAALSTLTSLSFEDRINDLISVNVNANGISHRIELRERFGALVTIFQVLGNFGEEGLKKLSIDKIVEFLFRTQNVGIEELVGDSQEAGTVIPGVDTATPPATPTASPQSAPVPTEQTVQ